MAKRMFIKFPGEEWKDLGPKSTELLSRNSGEDLLCIVDRIGELHGVKIEAEIREVAQ